jgi:hypothetical protein
MKEVFIILVLAIFAASGGFLIMIACADGQTVWPLVPIIVAALAILPLCSCRMLTVDTGMPASLADDADEQVGLPEVGWIFCGVVLTLAWGCPLILARHSILDMRVSWFASLGTWLLIGTMGMLIVLLVKGHGSSGSSYDYGY